MKWLWTAIPVFVFGLAGALIEDHINADRPYIFIGCTIIGAVLGGFLQVRFAPTRIIEKEE